MAQTPSRVACLCLLPSSQKLPQTQVQKATGGKGLQKLSGCSHNAHNAHNCLNMRNSPSFSPIPLKLGHCSGVRCSLQPSRILIWVCLAANPLEFQGRTKMHHFSSTCITPNCLVTQSMSSNPATTRNTEMKIMFRPFLSV